VNEAALHLVALAVVEVIGSQVVVGLMASEHVVEGNEHGMANGEDGATFATTRGNTTKLRR